MPPRAPVEAGAMREQARRTHPARYLAPAAVLAEALEMPGAAEECRRNPPARRATSFGDRLKALPCPDARAIGAEIGDVRLKLVRVNRAILQPWRWIGQHLRRELGRRVILCQPRLQTDIVPVLLKPRVAIALPGDIMLCASIHEADDRLQAFRG